MVSCGDDPGCGCSDDKSALKSKIGSPSSKTVVDVDKEKWVYATNECYILYSDQPESIGCCQIYKNCEFLQKEEFTNENSPAFLGKIAEENRSGNPNQSETWRFPERHVIVKFTVNPNSPLCCDYEQISY